MFCSLFKTTLRGVVILGVTGAVLAGGTMLIAGKDRTKAILHQVHGNVVNIIDENIDDPVALRRQLATLEQEYPQRIAALRGDLAELQQQIRQNEKDKAVAERVVAMAQSDLGELEEKLANATSRIGNARLASVSFDNQVYDYNRAVARVRQLKSICTSYSARANDADHSLGYLRQQADRFEEMVGTLQREHAEFQSQLRMMNDQVNAIARNERLIGLLEDRNKTLEECSRYKVVSLDQLSERLLEYRSRQEAELELLTSEQQRFDYEDMARYELDQAAKEAEALELTPSYHSLPGTAPALETEVR